MLELFSPQWWASLAAIIAVDLVLAGDNAVVIALAARRLPPELQKRAVIAGTFGAVLARVVLVFFALWLLEIPGLSIGGGLLLFYVAWRLAASDDNEQTDNRPAAKNFWQAMRTIIIADIVMGLDNILAIAGASRGNFELVVIGFALSVPIMIGGSVLILRLMKKAPWLVTAGAALLIAIAMRMILDDNLVGEHFPKQWEWPAVIAGALLFTIVIVLLQRRGADNGGNSPVTTVTEKGESQGGDDTNVRKIAKHAAAHTIIESVPTKPQRRVTMEKQPIRACQVWAVLAYAASKSQIITYDELSQATGYATPGLGELLLLVKNHCEANELPPITALVVSVRDGKPGNWDESEMGEWPSALQEIFQHSWSQKQAQDFVESF